MITTEKKKTVRTFDLVEVPMEIQPLLNILENKVKIDPSRALQQIGYKNPGSTITEFRRVGLAKRTLMYALKGLIAELNLDNKPASGDFILSYDEAELVFRALSLARKAMPSQEGPLKAINARIAEHLVKLTK